jgi:hypothetical protein
VTRLAYSFDVETKKGPPGEVGQDSERDKHLSGKRSLQCRAVGIDAGFSGSYMLYGI